MTVGIVGLGLIGGSMVKAYKSAGWTVYVQNRTASVAEGAILSGDADGKLTPETIPLCDIIHIALYPEASIKWLEDNAEFIDSRTIVADACGIKRLICDKCFPIAEKYGFTFFGAHPMAGTHFSGYKYSRSTMFNGAPMVIVPPDVCDMEQIERMKELIKPLGFGKIKVTTADRHDRMIAYTSQLAHVVSNAYIKSPSSYSHSGFSAGSFRDLTRVAWLNEGMWTELFLENRDHLSHEIGFIIDRLAEYKKALDENDEETLYSLLRDGRIAKELSEKSIKQDGASQ